jgi:hypothetical protein
MNIMDQFQEIGEAMLLAQEGKLQISRAASAKLTGFFTTLQTRLARLGAKTPPIQGWHP